MQIATDSQEAATPARPPQAPQEAQQPLPGPATGSKLKPASKSLREGGLATPQQRRQTSGYGAYPAAAGGASIAGLLPTELFMACCGPGGLSQAQGGTLEHSGSSPTLVPLPAELPDEIRRACGRALGKRSRAGPREQPAASSISGEP